MERAIRLGVTGGVGSGKSTVASAFKAMGADVVDADAIARQCTQPAGAAMPDILKAFGADMITAEGALDRGRMRERAFSDPQARQTLEGIIHPLVALEVQRLATLSTAPCLVFDVPLLVESPRWRPQLDAVLVVDCEPDTQVRRVMARSGLTAEAVQKVMNSQSPRVRRLQAADMVLYNEHVSLAQLHALVGQAAKRFGL